jgi:hypothetical protein
MAKTSKTMKPKPNGVRCLVCNLVYISNLADLAFCPADGSPLESVYVVRLDMTRSLVR